MTAKSFHEVTKGTKVHENNKGFVFFVSFVSS